MLLTNCLIKCLTEIFHVLFFLIAAMEDIAKGTLTSLASLFPSDEAKKAVKHVQDAIAEKQTELDKLHLFTSDNNNLLKLV